MGNVTSLILTCCIVHNSIHGDMQEISRYVNYASKNRGHIPVSHLQYYAMYSMMTYWNMATIYTVDLDNQSNL